MQADKDVLPEDGL
jgi:hypothetical protein